MLFKTQFFFLFFAILCSVVVKNTSNPLNLPIYDEFMSMEHDNCSFPNQIKFPVIGEKNNFESLSAYFKICQTAKLSKEEKILCTGVFSNIRNISCQDSPNTIPSINISLSIHECVDFENLKTAFSDSLYKHLSDPYFCSILCEGDRSITCKILLWSYQVMKVIQGATTGSEKADKDNIGASTGSKKADKDNKEQNVDEEQQKFSSNSSISSGATAGSEEVDKDNIASEKKKASVVVPNAENVLDNQKNDITSPETFLNINAKQPDSLHNIGITDGATVLKKDKTTLLNVNESDLQNQNDPSTKKLYVSNAVQEQEKYNIISKIGENTTGQNTSDTYRSKEHASKNILIPITLSNVNPLGEYSSDDDAHLPKTSVNKGKNEQSNQQLTLLISNTESSLPSTTAHENNLPELGPKGENKPDTNDQINITPQKPKSKLIKDADTVVTTPASPTLEKMESGDIPIPMEKDMDLYNDLENDSEYSKAEYDGGIYEQKSKPKTAVPEIKEAKGTVLNMNGVQKGFDGFSPRDQTYRRGPDDIQVIAAFPEQEDSHFFFYFLSIVLMLMAGYLIFHNKQKIIALIVEGRHERGRRRSHGVGYKKLDTK